MRQWHHATGHAKELRFVREKRHSQGRMLAVITALLWACGCSSTRTLDADYPAVAEALRQRFLRNEWTMRSTATSSFSEDPGQRLEITYFEWEYPDVKVKCELTARARGDGTTKVAVFAKDYDSWWSPTPLANRPGWARRVLDALERRLESGRWGAMPWGGDAVDPNRAPGGGGPAAEDVLPGMAD